MRAEKTDGLCVALSERLSGCPWVRLGDGDARLRLEDADRCKRQGDRAARGAVPEGPRERRRLDLRCARPCFGAECCDALQRPHGVGGEDPHRNRRLAERGCLAHGRRARHHVERGVRSDGTAAPDRGRGRRVYRGGIRVDLRRARVGSDAHLSRRKGSARLRYGAARQSYGSAGARAASGW